MKRTSKSSRDILNVSFGKDSKCADDIANFTSHKQETKLLKFSRTQHIGQKEQAINIVEESPALVDELELSVLQEFIFDKLPAFEGSFSRKRVFDRLLKIWMQHEPLLLKDYTFEGKIDSLREGAAIRTLLSPHYVYHGQVTQRKKGDDEDEDDILYPKLSLNRSRSQQIMLS